MNVDCSVRAWFSVVFVQIQIWACLKRVEIYVQRVFSKVYIFKMYSTKSCSKVRCINVSVSFGYFKYSIAIFLLLWTS